MMLSVFLFSLASGAISEPSYCCEKTLEGAWCTNDVQSACDSNYNAAPTSCESTSYCRLGTCLDSDEGICMGSTPQGVCNDNGGTWDPREPEEVPQCQLGCCVLADQAAFVSLTRCKKLSTFFGVENDYRTDIFNEISCIAEAQSQDVGACVYESDFERLCDFTTRGECGAGNVVENLGDDAEISSSKTFYKDTLCSAEELGTSCARQTTTSCYQGDVLWMDSCGNRENVYSNDKARSWNNGRVAEPSEVCVANDGSNVDCGNCDYMQGSRCAEFDGLIGSPSYGENYCQRTECVDNEGNDRINGESWCVGGESDNVGERYYRELCVDGVVKVEACGDYRNEICIGDSVDTVSGSFSTAACRVNRWQECVLQTEQDDCLNIDRRDCQWFPSVLGMILSGSSSGVTGETTTFSNPTIGAFTNPTGSGITGNTIFGADRDSTGGTDETSNRPDGICVPNIAPGLKFWEGESSKQICGQAKAKCVVEIELSLLDSLKNEYDDFEDAIRDEDYERAYNLCEGLDGKNCECLDDSWVESANGVCNALGDCGGDVNYNGDYSKDGYKFIIDGKEAFFR